ncbi:MAG TPA: hypothetical protein VFB62_14225, partial [Polyangiaceae bacterium]|nr:hypothetical protein [Polyangiaceae bacterium]
MARRIGDYEVVHGSNDLTRDAYVARNDGGDTVMLALFEIDEGDRRALEEEIERVKRLRHPSVMRPQHVFAHDASTGVVLEHVT